jgi:hypothetical protein
MSLYESRSSKRNKPIKGNKSSDIKGVFIIIKTIDQLKTIIEVKDKKDITRLIRSYILRLTQL